MHANYDRLISLKMPRYFLTPEKYNFDQKQLKERSRINKLSVFDRNSIFIFTILFQENRLSSNS